MAIPRVSPRTYHRVTVGALVALCTIVVTGAAVRLTGSGLGCTDWPTCEQGQFAPALDEVHGMIEFVNRLFTGVVSLAVILAVLGSLVRTPRRRDLTLLSLGLVAGVLAQIVWGAFTVWTQLDPRMVMGHYLISAVLVADAAALVQRAATGGTPIAPRVAGRVLWLGRLMVGMAILAIVTGTVVTNTGPHAGDEAAVRFGFDITSVARIHGISVLVLLGVVLSLLWSAYRTGAPTVVRRWAAVLVAVLVAQAVLGYAQFLLGVPALLVGFHVAGSVAVWLAVLALSFSLVQRPPREDLADTPGRPSGANPQESADAPPSTAPGDREPVAAAAAPATPPQRADDGLVDPIASP